MHEHGGWGRMGGGRVTGDHIAGDPGYGALGMRGIAPRENAGTLTPWPDGRREEGEACRRERICQRKDGRRRRMDKNRHTDWDGQVRQIEERARKREAARVLMRREAQSRAEGEREASRRLCYLTPKCLRFSLPRFIPHAQLGK